MDAYQQAVEYLTANPGEIHYAWTHPFNEVPGGCLFKMITPDGLVSKNSGGNDCGCLTMIRSRIGMCCHAWTEDLEVSIRSDERIPRNAMNITVDILPVFAQWQRFIDLKLNRTPPPLDTRIPAPTQEVEFALPEGVGV